MRLLSDSQELHKDKGFQKYSEGVWEKSKIQAERFKAVMDWSLYKLY